jgi:integrase
LREPRLHPPRLEPGRGDQRFNGSHEKAIEVWTAAEMAKLLANAASDFLPCLAIGGFAGLRTSEIPALDWSDVRLAERTIKVTHRKARCAGTRLAPITENLAKWLSPLACSRGGTTPCVTRAAHNALPLTRTSRRRRWRPGIPRRPSSRITEPSPPRPKAKLGSTSTRSKDRERRPDEEACR